MSQWVASRNPHSVRSTRKRSSLSRWNSLRASNKRSTRLNTSFETRPKIIQKKLSSSSLATLDSLRHVESASSIIGSSDRPSLRGCQIHINQIRKRLKLASNLTNLKSKLSGKNIAGIPKQKWSKLQKVEEKMRIHPAKDRYAIQKLRRILPATLKKSHMI